MSLPEAKAWGAVALFGETYDESVRVVEVGGPWSRELCGGTHVQRSSQIGLVSLTNESSVGSGSRRIEALVGIDAFRSLTQERILFHSIAEQLKTSPLSASEKLEQLLAELKDAQRKLQSVQNAALAELVPSLVSGANTLDKAKLVASVIEGASSVDGLRDLVIKVRDQLTDESAVIALFAVIETKPVVIIASTNSAQATGLKAGVLVRVVSTVLGGGGGGKADIAQGGGTDSSKFHVAIKTLEESLA
jgi:alanyl-tRNA synthetase